ncbi:MAG: response regulator transcription factor [Sulfurifustis sp.]
MKERIAKGVRTLRALESLVDVNTCQDFFGWARGELREIFPHEFLLCGIGRMTRGEVRAIRLLLVDFPMRYINSIVATDGKVASPVLAKWCRERKPQLFQLEEMRYEIEQRWVERFKKFELRNIAAHGAFNVDAGTFAYFSFSGIPQRLDARHLHLLWLLVPYMRDALRRMPETTASQVIDFHQRPRLTAREAEVVRWLRKGKTNREIARILKVSDKTIKTHLQRLYDKLNVRNRMEAVWTLEFGLDESPRWARPLFDATPRVLS